MYLFWLSTFKKVIDEGSYTRAAAGLFVSQSAVSQQVRQLEKLFGTKLIQMTGRRLELTSAGHQVYRFASSMESEYEATHQAIDALLGRSRSHVVIVSAVPVLLRRLAAVMKRFWAEHPEVTIETVMRTGGEIVDALRSGAADLGIYTGDDFDSSLVAASVWTDAVVAVTAPQHAPVHAGAMSAKEVANSRVVVGGGSEVRRLVDEWFGAHEVKLTNVMELPSLEGLRSAVVESGAIAFGPHYAVQDDLASARLREVEIEGFCVSARTFVLHKAGVREPVRWLVDLVAEPGDDQAVLAEEIGADRPDSEAGTHHDLLDR
jgi:DNA-binding transcriptional LysR family regulator